MNTISDSFIEVQWFRIEATDGFEWCWRQMVVGKIAGYKSEMYRRELFGLATLQTLLSSASLSTGSRAEVESLTWVGQV